MSKDARSEDLDLTSEAKVKLDELVPLLARTDRRAKPPSHKSNSSAIRPGWLVARAVDAHLAARHAAQFTEEEPCPTCDEKCSPRASPHDLPLQTQNGEVTLHKPTCHCSSCRQDFFPQRIALRIDGGSSSPAVLLKKTLDAAYTPSFSVGANVL